MPKYTYTAIDDYGKKLEGVLEAENEKALEEHLASKGYYLLNAEEGRVEPSPQESPLSRESPKKPRKLKKWLAIGLGSFLGLLLLLFIVGLFLPEQQKKVYYKVGYIMGADGVPIIVSGAEPTEWEDWQISELADKLANEVAEREEKVLETLHMSKGFGTRSVRRIEIKRGIESRLKMEIDAIRRGLKKNIDMRFVMTGFRTDFRNEPDGFREIKWGANIKDIPTMVFVSEERDIEDISYVKTYKRKNDELYVDSVNVKSIRYDFVLIKREYRFGAVFISFEGESNFKKIKEMLDYKHGKGNQFYNDLEEYYWWSWPNTDINLRKVSKDGDEGELCYLSSQMTRKLIKE